MARLLHDFNTEFDEEPPEVAVLAERVAEFIEKAEAVFLLAGDGPDGIAQMRFFPSLWSGELDAYLEELYVVPELRGGGIGRALLESAMETARAAGATRMDLNTGETDTAARALYESTGFTNREGSEDGPSMLYYEREL
ncbi:MAG TPA: GNAT family N-acetyltransferase [Solirubrobacterales bacterium]|nr:GNAT family N-acetyltransferase [Solirubrobacterales bacterium]